MSISRGQRVHTMAQLRTLAAARKSVVGFRPCNPDYPAPAAFVMSMQAWSVDEAIRRGMWVYKPKFKKKFTIEEYRKDNQE